MNDTTYTNTRPAWEIEQERLEHKVDFLQRQLDEARKNVSAGVAENRVLRSVIREMTLVLVERD